MKLILHQSDSIHVWYGDLLVLSIEHGEDVGDITVSIERSEK